MKILVSACLLGKNCKYNGGNNLSPEVLAYVADREVIPVCPETAAGLGTPRVPVEILGGVVQDREGHSVDQALRAAIAEILRSIVGEDIECAILKSRSPTCGVKEVYDGTFTGTLIPGSGLFAQALKDAGYKVIDAEDLGPI